MAKRPPLPRKWPVEAILARWPHGYKRKSTSALIPKSRLVGPSDPRTDVLSPGGIRLHIKRRRALREVWSADWASKGWAVLYPRDLDRDGPAWVARKPRHAKGGGPPPHNWVQHRVKFPIVGPRREPMPPEPGAPEEEWLEWERAELAVMTTWPGWRKLSASARTSAGLRKRARMLRFIRGKPLWYVARSAGISGPRLGALLRGKRTKLGASATPSWYEARRLARALSVSLEELACWLDAVRVDPIV